MSFTITCMYSMQYECGNFGKIQVTTSGTHEKSSFAIWVSVKSIVFSTAPIDLGVWVLHKFHWVLLVGQAVEEKSHLDDLMGRKLSQAFRNIKQPA